MSTKNTLKETISGHRGDDRKETRSAEFGASVYSTTLMSQQRGEQHGQDQSSNGVVYTVNSAKQTENSELSDRPHKSQQDSSVESRRSSSISVLRLHEIAEAFERSVATSDQWFKVRKYRDCFVGNEAVDCMVDSGIASSRQEAVAIGNALMREINLFEHVHRNHSFEDAFLFYRFVKEMNRFIAIDDEVTALACLGDAYLTGERDGAPVRKSVAVRSLEESAQVFKKAVQLSDRRYRLRVYRDSFVGSEGVDVMMSYGLASSRQDAVALGRRMAKELNLFKHVMGEHEFKDAFLFYRFEQTGTRHKPGLMGPSGGSASFELFEPLSLEQIAAIFEKDMPVKTHRYRLREYPLTFLANDAVDFFVTRQMATSRSDAVRIGRALSEELNLFHHALNDRPFADDQLLFKFTSTQLRKPQNEEKRGGSVAFGDLTQVALAFRQGVTVRKNYYRFKAYKDTFVGSEAVSFLVNSSLAPSRKHAVHLGRILERQFNLFQHVTQEWEFCDDYKFFRFVKQDKHLSSALSSELMTEAELAPEKIAEALRSGVQVKDRSYRLKVYKNCFLGNEAVDFLVGSRFAATRQEAVELGRSLAREFDLFHHVCDEHDLEDEPLFYLFTNLGAIRPLSTSALTLTAAQLKEIAATMEKSIPLSSNRYNLRVYHNTFTGKEGVNFLLSSGSAKSRQEAVLIGRALQSTFNLFAHVSAKHQFSDQVLFYRFVPESLRRSWDEEETDASDAIFALPKFGVVSSDEDWRRRVLAFEAKVMSKSRFLSSPRSADKAYGRDRRLQDPAQRLKRWAREFRRTDPRYKILSFFNDAAQEGVNNMEGSNEVNPELLRPLLRYFSPCSVFSVWRPTSFEAIRKMILGEAVGKGLDIKGKSALRGKLSGFVPFLQITENRHKSKIRTLPKHGVVRLFFPGSARRGRDNVAEKLEDVAKDMIECVEMAKELLESDKPVSKADRDEALACMLLDMIDPTISYIEDYAPKCYGLEIPVRLFWEAYVVRQDINREPGSEFDTGRPSQPAFQDMNFASLHCKPKQDAPRAVLYQHCGVDAPMSPFGILLAYEENDRVMPVVSDFDCFLLGSRGVSYSTPIPPDQVSILKWCVRKMETILEGNGKGGNWTTQWLAILKDAASNGFHPHIPRYGFGDPKTYSLMEQAIRRLRDQGSVRHGAESFNYFFPQQLDDQFLILSESIPGQSLPWKYVDVEGLQKFLCDKIDDGFTFPLNPKWILCDPGWSVIYNKLLASDKANVQDSLRVWYPVESGVRERIHHISLRFPQGFRGQNGEDSDVVARASGTGSMDLALDELKRKHFGVNDRSYSDIPDAIEKS